MVVPSRSSKNCAFLHVSIATLTVVLFCGQIAYGIVSPDSVTSEAAARSGSKTSLAPSHATPVKVTPVPMSAPALETFVMPVGLPPNRNNLLSIVYNGYRRSSLEPCGCVSHKLGGIDREAAVLEAITSGGLPLVKLEAGGYVRDMAAESQAFKTATKHLLRALSALGYDVFNVSATDLEIGKDFLIDALGARADRLVSANLVDPVTSEPLFKTYQIIPVTLRNDTNLRLGVTGITRGRIGIPTPGAAPKSYAVQDPVEALRKVIPELQKKCDVVILLAYMNREALANDVLSRLETAVRPDIAIAGEYLGNRNDVENVSGVMVVSGGFEGRQVGHLVLEIRDGKIAQQFNKLVEIEQTIPPKAEITQIVTDYLK
ncbi:MAG: hypothetical protein N2Z21_04185, partial [Candidatus Sumerlaeaceae bacterium]|nr:hypothetical protein [Candidatus Sumerlaeaceae bacterium]